jgi:Na+/H+ antiporter NhaD/arsenite permease-like protein
VCLAFTPLVLEICEALACDPKPYLLALATSSNIGSVATITGNPQNILIASLSHIGYRQFAARLAPIALIALVINVAVIAIVHRRALATPFPHRDETSRPPARSADVWKGALVTVAVLVAFVAGAPPALAALLGGSAMLLTRATDPRKLYAEVDWTLLALFTGLFVVVGGIERAGVAQYLVGFFTAVKSDTVWGLTVLSAALSNVVSNVPAVMVLKSSIPHLPHPETAWLTLAMASTLAGNLTLPGSLATIIVVERARERTEITFLDFLAVGLPSALLSLAIGVLWMTFVG